MKKLMLLGLMILTLGACSKSKDDGDGGKALSPAEFQKASAGSWASNCRVENETPYVEILTIQPNGTGSSTYMVFGQANCQGPIVQQPQVVEFTYKVTGNDGATTKMDLNIQGQIVPVGVRINGDIMTVTANGNSVDYRKQAAQ